MGEPVSQPYTGSGLVGRLSAVIGDLRLDDKVTEDGQSEQGSSCWEDQPLWLYHLINMQCAQQQCGVLLGLAPEVQLPSGKTAITFAYFNVSWTEEQSHGYLLGDPLPFALDSPAIADSTECIQIRLVNSRAKTDLERLLLGHYVAPCQLSHPGRVLYILDCSSPADRQRSHHVVMLPSEFISKSAVKSASTQRLELDEVLDSGIHPLMLEAPGAHLGQMIQEFYHACSNIWEGDKVELPWGGYYSFGLDHHTPLGDMKHLLGFEHMLNERLNEFDDFDALKAGEAYANCGEDDVSSGCSGSATDEYSRMDNMKVKDDASGSDMDSGATDDFPVAMELTLIQLPDRSKTCMVDGKVNDDAEGTC